jgi:hypothetical protein
MNLNELILMMLEEYNPPYAPQNLYSFSGNFAGYAPMGTNPMEDKPVLLKRKRKRKKRS